MSSIKKNSLKNILNIEYNNQEENAPTSEILEIQDSYFKDKFTIRCEKNITKYSYEDCMVKCLYNIHRKSVPFITFCEDPSNENIILTGDLNRQVLIWDLNYSVNDPFLKLISQNDNILERSDNWNIIRHFNNSSYVFADFEKFALIDSRIKHAAKEMNFSTFKENIGICENISSLSLSDKYANIIYIGTTHKIFAIDARFLKKNSEKIILLKWFHQMQYPPLILKAHNCIDFELIAASSPLNGEIRLFEVKKTDTENMKTKYISSFLPISPPNLIESFYFTKLQGDCLNPLVNFESRIKKCTTGITFFEKNEKLQLIIENSIGDILACKITFNEENEYSKKYNYDVIKNYYNAVKEKTEENSRELCVTDVKDMKNMNKILRCAKLNTNEEFSQQNNNNFSQSENYGSNENDNLIDYFPMKRRKLWKWEKMPSHYAQCKDVLASNLLQIWEFDVNETEGEKLFEKKSYSQSDRELYQSRVNDWVKDIQKNYYKNNIFSGETIEDIFLTEEIINSRDKCFKLSNSDSSNSSKTSFKTSFSNKTQPNVLNKKFETNSDKNKQISKKKITNRAKIENFDINLSNNSNNSRNNLLDKTKFNWDKINEPNSILPNKTQQQSLIEIKTPNLSNNTKIEKLTKKNSGTELFNETQINIINLTGDNKKAIAKKRQYIKGF